MGATFDTSLHVPTSGPTCGREWSTSGGSRAFEVSMTAVMPIVKMARTDHPMPTGKVTPHHTCLQSKEPGDPPEGRTSNLRL